MLYSILSGHGKDDSNTGVHMFFELVTKTVFRVRNSKRV